MSRADSPKQQMIEALQNLPDDITWSRVRYTADLLEGLQEAEEDVRNGRVFTNAEVKAQMRDWSEEWRSQSTGPTEPATISVS